MRKRSISFETACRQYVHRFTCEHVPAWAREQRPDGSYYAPQYSSDRDWYERTVFPGEPDYIGNGRECNSRGQSWPLGKALSTPWHGVCT